MALISKEDLLKALELEAENANERCLAMVVKQDAGGLDRASGVCVGLARAIERVKEADEIEQGPQAEDFGSFVCRIFKPSTGAKS